METEIVAIGAESGHNNMRTVVHISVPDMGLVFVYGHKAKPTPERAGPAQKTVSSNAAAS